MVTGEQSGQCFRLSAEKTKAAFYFHRDASRTYSLREEPLSLKKGDPIPFCLNASNQQVALCPCECGPAQTDTSFLWNSDSLTTTCSRLDLYMTGDNTDVILISLSVSQ